MEWLEYALFWPVVIFIWGAIPATIAALALLMYKYYRKED
jgi:hypothetical protein